MKAVVILVRLGRSNTSPVTTVIVGPFEEGLVPAALEHIFSLDNVISVAQYKLLDMLDFDVFLDQFAKNVAEPAIEDGLL